MHNAGTTQECKMPNGRSGGLPPRLVSSSEVSRLIEECPHDRIAVEEQDSMAYVIHISNEPELNGFLLVHNPRYFRRSGNDTLSG